VEKQINIFLATGPLVALASIDTINQYYSDDTQKNILVYFGDLDLRECGAIANNTITITIKQRSLAQRYAGAVATRRIIEKAAGYRRLFIGNVAHLATNFAALNCHFDEKHLVTEGIANYYNISFKNKLTPLNILAKICLATLAGIKFKPIHSHVSGFETGVFDSCFFYNSAGLVTNPGKSRALNGKTIPVDQRGSRRIMLVEQPVEIMMEKSEVAKTRLAIDQYIAKAENLGAQVFYKRHPSYNAPPCKSETSVLLSENVPAEILIQKYSINECVSVASSTLLTCQDMFTNVQSTSIGLNGLANSATSKMLTVLFMQRSINLISI
jgi:hypothetical protein